MGSPLLVSDKKKYVAETTYNNWEIVRFQGLNTRKGQIVRYKTTKQC